MQFMNHLADIYPVQIIILVENWNIRDVHLKLKKYELNSNIQIFLDNEGKNILKLSSLDDIFINFGFMIIDNELNIYYLQLGSFEYPYSNSKLENIFDIANRFLQLK
jgi:GH43 family beta-xylosidase